MLVEECKINGRLVSKLEVVNVGHTKNYNFTSYGPHECKYKVKYTEVIEGKKKPLVIKFAVHHDRLDGHNRLVEICRSIITTKRSELEWKKEVEENEDV